jgi:hypothetical protein
VLTHDFHQWSLLRATPRVFGVPTIGQWRRMRLRGMSPLEIGARLGRDDGVAIRRDLVKVIERSADRGVRAGATSRAQADRFVAQQRRTLERWLRSPLVRPPTEPSGARAMGRSALCHI